MVCGVGGVWCVVRGGVAARFRSVVSCFYDYPFRSRQFVDFVTTLTNFVWEYSDSAHFSWAPFRFSIIQLC